MRTCFNFLKGSHISYLKTTLSKSADDVCIRTQVQVRVRDLPDLFLAEAIVLPDRDHAPCCHASQGQKE